VTSQEIVKPTDTLVSVVIPTFNRRPSLAKVIRPLLEDPSTGEIVIVVDGGRDGSLEFLREWAQTELRLRVFYQENAGQSVARRRGIEASRHDIVVVLDDDVEADSGLISAHAQWHVKNERLLVLGYMPTVLPSPRRPGQATTFLYAADYESTCELYENDARSIFTHLWAGNMSMKRTDVVDLGSDAERRIYAHEDLRFGLQSRDAGIEAVFDRSLSARHLYRRSLRKFAADCRRSGGGLARLSREYPSLADQLNPLTSHSARENLIARYLGSSFVRTFSAPLAMAVSFGSGRVHAWRLETIAVRVLRLIETAYEFRCSSDVLPGTTGKR
jgi:glycosyltransferase involved in cell wall biosynthesis